MYCLLLDIKQKSILWFLVYGRQKRNEVNNLHVSCYSGHTYAERPQSFRWEGRDYEVEQIEKAWLEPGKRYFQIRSRDNKKFRLCYDEKARQWSIIELILWKPERQYVAAATPYDFLQDRLEKLNQVTYQKLNTAIYTRENTN